MNNDVVFKGKLILPEVPNIYRANPSPRAWKHHAKITLEIRAKTTMQRDIDLNKIYGAVYEISLVGDIMRRHVFDSGGQCQDTIAEMYPDNKKVQRIVQLWDRWHLNDLRTGSRPQQAALDGYRQAFGRNDEEAELDFVQKTLIQGMVRRGDGGLIGNEVGWDEINQATRDVRDRLVKYTAFVNHYEYDHACEILKELGLYDDRGYKYGHEWLVEIVPDEVITELKELLGGEA